MQRFENGQRVKVNCEGDCLHGRIGTVRRLRQGGEAWIRFDDPIPKECASFPPDDERGRDVCMFPCDCEPLDS